MHTDEAVQGVKFLQLWEHGQYRYDPNEYHGPALNYLTLPTAKLAAGTPERLDEGDLRLTPALFGIGLVLLAFLWKGPLEPAAAAAAAAITALSPAMIFYNRYYIHESLFVFFGALFLLGAWRYGLSGRLGWAAAAGLGLGLMCAAKETFVFNLAAAAGAAGLARALPRPAGETPLPWRERLAGLAPWAVGLGLGAIAAGLLFTSFGRNPGGPLDLFRAYLPWFRRAGGASPHIHPWFFYFERLLWWRHSGGPLFTEAAVWLLALAGAAAGFTGWGAPKGRSAFLRFLACYTILLTAIYTVISYKTPWCVLSFHYGFILLAGAGAAALWRALRAPALRAALALALAAAAAHLGAQAWRVIKPYAASPANPWVYAHTDPELLKLVRRVQGIRAVHPRPERMVVKVMASGGDYWPLPWYLRNLPHVGWYDREPEDPFADVVIAGGRINPKLDERSQDWIMAGYYKLRPKVFLSLYAKFDLWKAYVETLPPPEERQDD